MDNKNTDNLYIIICLNGHSKKINLTRQPDPQNEVSVQPDPQNKVSGFWYTIENKKKVYIVNFTGKMRWLC